MNNTEIFAERIRDEIFDDEIVATLRRGLSDEKSYIAISMTKIFTAAIAHGMLHSFCWIFIQNFLQRVCGTGCLTVGSLPNLNVYYVI